MADQLHKELPNLLAVRRVMVAALGELMSVAEKEGHDETVGFAENLNLKLQLKA